MSDTTFRTAMPTPQAAPEATTPHEPNERGATSDLGMEEPIEGAQAEDAMLRLLGVDDPLGMPESDAQDLNELTAYVLEIVKQKGASPTDSSMRRALESIKEEFGLDPQAEPTAILKRVGGMVKAWKEISFIRDTSERRRIFMRLARLPDSRSIDQAVMAEMEVRKIWR